MGYRPRGFTPALRRSDRYPRVCPGRLIGMTSASTAADLVFVECSDDNTYWRNVPANVWNYKLGECSTLRETFKMWGAS